MTLLTMMVSASLTSMIRSFPTIIHYTPQLLTRIMSIYLFAAGFGVTESQQPGHV